MRVYVIDFEGSLKYGIVEYGVVLLEGGSIVRTQTGLCRPEQAIHPRDIQIHGLKEDRLKDEPDFSQYRDQFYGYRFDGVLAAHHAPVENGLLNRYWHTVPSRAVLGHTNPSRGSWAPWIDSRLVYQRYYDLESYSLMALIDQFQLQNPLQELVGKYCPPERSKPHCALYDALASALLLLKTAEHLGLGPEEWLRASQSGFDNDSAQTDLL